MFPEHSGNVKLSCQFAEIHEDSTIWWMKDSKSIAQVQRRCDIHPPPPARLLFTVGCLFHNTVLKENSKL